MKRIMIGLIVVFGLVSLHSPAAVAPASVAVTVRNPIDISRPGETIMLQAASQRAD